MHRFALITALLLFASACEDVPGVYDPPEECIGNTAPGINNLELNSWQDEDTMMWIMCIHFDWRDPVDPGTSAPNMLGGFISAEVQGFDTDSEWLDGSLVPDLAAEQGEIDWILCSEDFAQDVYLDFEMRVRDSCGAVSNEKSGEYCIGQGVCDYSQPANPYVRENEEGATQGCQRRDNVCGEEPPPP